MTELAPPESDTFDLNILDRVLFKASLYRPFKHKERAKELQKQRKAEKDTLEEKKDSNSSN